MKSRGMNHSKDVKSFMMSSSGILLNPISKNVLDSKVGSETSKKKNLLANQSIPSGNHKSK